MPQNITQDFTPSKDQVQTTVFSVGIISPITTSNRAEDLFRLVEPLSALNFKLNVLAEGEEVHQNELFKLSEAHSDNLEVLEQVAQNKQTVLSNSQVVLFMQAPTKAELASLAKNNVIAIMPNTVKLEGLVNFDAQKEVGNCFMYDPENFWDCLANVLRAYET